MNLGTRKHSFGLVGANQWEIKNMRTNHLDHINNGRNCNKYEAWHFLISFNVVCFTRCITSKWRTWQTLPRIRKPCQSIVNIIIFIPSHNATTFNDNANCTFRRWIQCLKNAFNEHKEHRGLWWEGHLTSYQATTLPIHNTRDNLW